MTEIGSVIVYALGIFIAVMIISNIITALFSCHHCRDKLLNSGYTKYCDGVGMVYTNVPYQKWYCSKCKKSIYWIKYESGWRIADFND